MKKEVSKVVETTLPQVMERYGAYFSIELGGGFAHIKIEDGGKMFVELLDDEGYDVKDNNHIQFEDIEIIANFMREMKELKLENYSK